MLSPRWPTSETLQTDQKSINQRWRPYFPFSTSEISYTFVLYFRQYPTVITFVHWQKPRACYHWDMLRRPFREWNSGGPIHVLKMNHHVQPSLKQSFEEGNVVPVCHFFKALGGIGSTDLLGMWAEISRRSRNCRRFTACCLEKRDSKRLTLTIQTPFVKLITMYILMVFMGLTSWDIGKPSTEGYLIA